MRNLKLILGAAEITMAYYFMSILSVQWAADMVDMQTMWSLPLMVAALTLFCAVIMIATRSDRGKGWDIVVCALSALVLLATIIFVPSPEQGKVRAVSIVVNALNFAISVSSIRMKSGKVG